MLHDLISMQQQAEFVGAAVYLRAMLARAAMDEPEVVSLRVEVSFDGPGASSIDCELIDRYGMAVGGLSI